MKLQMTASGYYHCDYELPDGRLVLEASDDRSPIILTDGRKLTGGWYSSATCEDFARLHIDGVEVCWFEAGRGAEIPDWLAELIPHRWLPLLRAGTHGCGHGSWMRVGEKEVYGDYGSLGAHTGTHEIRLLKGVEHTLEACLNDLKVSGVVGPFPRYIRGGTMWYSR